MKRILSWFAWGAFQCGMAYSASPQNAPGKMQPPPAVRLGDSRWAHAAGILALEFKPDGHELVTGTEDGSVYEWRFPGGDLVRKSRLHRGFVTDLQVLSNGNVLTVGVDGKVILLESTGSKVVGQAKSSIVAIVASKNGTTAFVATSDGPIEIWNVEKCVRKGELPGHAGGTQCLALSSDGQRLVSGGFDGNIRVWDTLAPKELLSLPGNSIAVTTVAISGDGSHLFCGVMGGGLRVWDATTGLEQSPALSEGDTPLKLRWSSDGAVLASGSMGGVVSLWERVSLKKVKALEPVRGGLSGKCFALSPDAKVVVSQQRAMGILDVWEVATGAEVAPRRGHTAGVVQIAYSPDGSEMASAGVDGRVLLWNLGRGEIVHRLEGHVGSVYGLAFSRSGRLLASGGTDGAVHLWDVASGKLTQTLKEQSKRVTSLAFAQNDDLIISASLDGALIAWDLKTGKPATVVPTGASLAQKEIALSRDGKTVALGDESNTISMFSVPDLEQRGSISIPKEASAWGLPYVRAMDFSPDGKWLATVMTGAIHIWSVEKRDLIRRISFEPGSRGLTGVSFSADGKLLGSSSEDGALRIYRTSTWTLADTLPAIEGVAKCVRFSPTTSSVAVGGNDTTVVVFEDKWVR